MRHAVCLQRIQLGQTQLQGMESKKVSNSGVKLCLLPSQQIAPGGGLKPVRQTYNSTTHAPVTDFFLVQRCCQ